MENTERLYKTERRVVRKGGERWQEKMKRNSRCVNEREKKIGRMLQLI